MESRFDCKPWTQPPLCFVGITITPMEGGIYKLEQPSYANHFRVLPADASLDQFWSLRQQIAWLGQRKPDLVAVTSICSQMTTESFWKAHVKIRNV